jgi:hypothetical protein
MSSYISVALRQLVADRANHRCEYCLIPQEASFLTFEQVWEQHFRLTDGEIIGATAEGRVTVAILQFNTVERVRERHALITAGMYPQQR